MTLLEVANVRAGYGRLEILQGVSLAIEPDEVVGVIGPNGAGKSTLIKTIFGYLKPFAGEIRFEGEPIGAMRPDRIMRRGLGYVSQAGGIFPDMSVAENLALGGYSLRSRHRRAERRADSRRCPPHRGARHGTQRLRRHCGGTARLRPHPPPLPRRGTGVRLQRQKFPPPLAGEGD